MTPDTPLLSEYRQYVGRYPTSPYVPPLTELLFDDALAHHDLAQMEQIVDGLRVHFPKHVVTDRLAGQWKRERAVGRPFWLTFVQPDGVTLDTRTWVGQPVLIVVWASSDAACRQLLSRADQFRREDPELRIVGVNLDLDRRDMTATMAELKLDWPQFNDGLGPANSFAREWGVHQAGWVFVIDRAGRLVGSAPADGWERLASETLRSGAGISGGK